MKKMTLAVATLLVSFAATSALADAIQLKCTDQISGKKMQASIARSIFRGPDWSIILNLQDGYGETLRGRINKNAELVFLDAGNGRAIAVSIDAWAVIGDNPAPSYNLYTHFDGYKNLKCDVVDRREDD